MQPYSPTTDRPLERRHRPKPQWPAMCTGMPWKKRGTSVSRHKGETNGSEEGQEESWRGEAMMATRGRRRGQTDIIVAAAAAARKQMHQARRAKVGDDGQEEKEGFQSKQNSMR